MKVEIRKEELCGPVRDYLHELGRISAAAVQRKFEIHLRRAQRIIKHLFDAGELDGLRSADVVAEKNEVANPAVSRIDKQLTLFDPESTRAKTLMALKSFRVSWTALGRLLTDVAYCGDYKEWGYEDFEVYCARELGLKKPTVKKLMVSYNYLKKYESARLENGGDVPEYTTVEELHRVRENDSIDEETVKEVHAKVFAAEDNEELLRKEMKELRKEAELFDDKIDAANRARRLEMQDVRRTARLLRKKIAHSKYVPGGLSDRFDEMLTELEALD